MGLDQPSRAPPFRGGKIAALKRQKSYIARQYLCIKQLVISSVNFPAKRCTIGTKVELELYQTGISFKAYFKGARTLRFPNGLQSQSLHS